MRAHVKEMVDGEMEGDSGEVPFCSFWSRNLIRIERDKPSGLESSTFFRRTFTFFFARVPETASCRWGFAGDAGPRRGRR
jgi:hypothetical protein